MQIKVVPAIGNEIPFEMEVDPDEDVGSLKKRVAKQCGVPASALTLTCRGIELQDDNSTLGSLGIQEGDKIFYVSSDIEGG
ncbi:MAG: ubiquitin-like domain-containing protein [Candidatus Jordarchaeum sp.]|uniref:ubiquitin-like domain-containing protein n=1 Tax=Candidatus Jordarchaeum sp. TaxID=2823881 RepID=UPI00404A620A